MLSAFNGIETMIETLYSEFEPDITITAKKRKTFDESEINWRKIKKCKGILTFSKGLEEVVVLRHEKKWVNATLIGVESNFLRPIKIKDHLLAGEVLFKEKNGAAYGIIGVGLMQKLNARKGFQSEHEQILIYAPKRNIKIRFGKTPFYSEQISISGIMNYNNEINQEKILWPLENTRNLLKYSTELSHIYIAVLPNLSNDEMKKKIMEIVGDNFIVKTNYEKNELIFKTSKSERIIILLILVFIFILASFNIVASLTMLFIEKKPNIQTLRSLGLTEKNIFRIFFFEGLLISGSGVIFGLIFGYFLCFLQIKYHLLTIPGVNTPFPIKFAFEDFLLVISSLCSLSILFSYFSVKFLLQNKDKNN